MRVIPVLLLAACAAQPRQPPAPAHTFKAFYEGRAHPLPKVAVLLTLTPPGHTGLAFAGRVEDPVTGRVLHVPLGLDLIELAPGSYGVEAYFWVGRSRFEATPAGERALVIERLTNAEIAPLTITVDAGKTYYLEPELRRTEEIPEGDRGRYFRLRYGATFEQIKSPPPAARAVIDEYVWRPHLAVVPPDEAAQYRRYR